MTNHPLPSAGNSQCAIIREKLEAERGEWVAMVALARAAGCYAVHSRVSDLRQHHDLHIEQRNTYRTVRGRRKCLSYYRLS